MAAQAITSQDGLARALRRKGIDVTQSTLSRDLRELKVSRGPVPVPLVRRHAGANGNGAEPAANGPSPGEVLGVEANEALVVVRTGTGRAPGVAVALGLGKAVVDGAPCLRFCPKYPRHLVALSAVDDALKNSQREFYALDMEEDPNAHLLDEGETGLTLYDLGNHVGAHGQRVGQVARAVAAERDHGLAR